MRIHCFVCGVAIATARRAVCGATRSNRGKTFTYIHLNTIYFLYHTHTGLDVIKCFGNLLACLPFSMASILIFFFLLLLSLLRILSLYALCQYHRGRRHRSPSSLPILKIKLGTRIEWFIIMVVISNYCIIIIYISMYIYYIRDSDESTAQHTHTHIGSCTMTTPPTVDATPFN